MILKSIAEQTENGKIQWDCVEYNPLGFMDEDRIDDEPAYLSQIFTFSAFISGGFYTLDLYEKINIPDGKGDIGITLTRDVENDLMQIDTGLSFRYEEYDACPTDQLAERFHDDPAVLLSNILVPQAVETDIVRNSFTWTRFFNEKNISKPLLNHPITRLGVRLFNDRRLLDYHRCVLDIPYRNLLMAEPDDQDEPVGNSAYEIVHWVNRELQNYKENPPKKLVEQVAKEKNISLEEARKHIPFDMLFDDLVKKVGQANNEFIEMDASDPAVMRRLLKHQTEENN